jgi:hypothetical protein
MQATAKAKPRNLADQLAELRSAKVADPYYPAIPTAGRLYYGQKPRVPKKHNKGSPQEVRVQSILAAIDQKDGLPDDWDPADIERAVKWSWEHRHPDVELPDRKTLKQAYQNYLTKRAVK